MVKRNIKKAYLLAYIFKIFFVFTFVIACNSLGKKPVLHNINVVECSCVLAHKIRCYMLKTLDLENVFAGYINFSLEGCTHDNMLNGTPVT